MEYIYINDKEYKFVYGNSKDERYRNSFNDLTEKTFGFNFEEWYRGEYWTERYRPYSLLDGERVIANVSVNPMELEVFGERKNYIQLGTIMTDVKYRNHGLSRVLMQRILNEWKDKCDLIYLFANDSAVDFYPRFGFEKLEEQQFEIEKSRNINIGDIKKLDMNNKCDRELVYAKATRAVPISQLSMIGNAELVMFYATSFMKDNVYYIRDFDAVVFVNYDGAIMELLEVLCSDVLSIKKLIDYISKEGTERVKFYFTPKESNNYLIKPLEGEDTLYALGRDKECLEGKKIMFPKLSHT